MELIFNEPITQRQIDEFLRLGGQITYIYQAVSYGWNGYISRQSINLLPSAMGSTLVQVEAAQQIQYYMDTATQTGRVRPVWKAGFAGVAGGVRGDPTITIGFLGGGVDDTHRDLKGRCVYWKDLTDDNEPVPADYDGHDTLVAGIAIGTGAAGGADEGELRFTYTYADSFAPTYGHITDPITLPARQITMKILRLVDPGPDLYHRPISMDPRDRRRHQYEGGRQLHQEPIAGGPDQRVYRFHQRCFLYGALGL